GRFDGFRVKGRGSESTVASPVLLDGSDTSKKTWFLHGAAINGDTVGAYGSGLINFRSDHLRTDPVRHLNAGQSVSVLNDADAEAHWLAKFIPPIGSVGGHANLDGTDAILGD